MFMRSLNHVRRWVMVCFIGLVLLLATTLSAGRWLMLNLMEFKPELEQLISNSPHFQISVGELSGSWIAFSPRLEATAVTITLAGGRRIDVGRMALQFDTLGSLWRREAVFRQVLIDQLDLSLYRSRERGWGLAGASPAAAKNNNQAPANSQGDLLPLLQALLVHQELEIRNALVQVQFEQQQPLPPQRINVKFQHQANNYALEGQLGLGQEQAIDLRALLHGLPGEAGFSSEFYFNAPVLDQQFWGQFSASALLPQRFQLGAEVWGRWRPDGQHVVQGRVELPSLDWQQNSKHLSIADAGLQFYAALDGLQQGELAITGLQGKIDGVDLPLQRLSLRKQGPQWLFSSDALVLAPLWQIINDSALVADSLKLRLAGLDPVGELRNPRFEWQMATDTAPMAFDFSADLNQVGVSPWHGAPGLQGVDGLLQVNAAGGRVDFSSDRFGLNFPKLYAQGWQFEHARGVVSWHVGPAGVTVASERLQIDDQRLRANGRFSLDLPAKSHPEQAGRLVLMIGMEQADATLASLFVPDKIFSKPLFSWLQQSITGGQVSSGGVIVDTPLHPQTDSPQRTVQLFFNADQASLWYQPEWPELTQANPFILVKGSELLVEIPQGKLLGTDVSRGRVYLPPHSSSLQIEAELEGPAADIRTTLIQAPTRAVLGEALRPWQLDGVSHSKLALGIDLQHPERSLVRIESKLSDGLLSNAGLGVDFSQLAGTLRYHEREGLSSDRISGSLLGQPLQADIVTEQHPEGPRTLVRGGGWVSIEPLKDWLQQPLLHALQGETPYQARLQICAGIPGCSNLRIDSQLRGVVVNMPAPFAKTAEQSQPLEIDISLDETPHMRLRYAQQLDFAMPLGGGFSGGELVLGRGQSAALSRDDGLWIRGQLDTLAVAPWQAFITQAFVNPDTAGAAGPAVAATDPAQIIKWVQLDIGRLDFGALQVEQLQAQLTPGAESWELVLDSPMVRGRVLWPGKQGVTQIGLDYLYVPQLETQTDVDKVRSAAPFDPSQDPLLSFDPRSLPAAQISITALRYGERDLGRWDFGLQPGPDGVLIDTLKATVGNLGVVADVDWQFKDQQHSSVVDLALTTTDLGKVLLEWGATPGLATESALLSGQFNWQGSPLAFNWQTLDGESELQVTNGRVLDTGGGSQVVKIFSLFNTNTIWRRLSLDFSDLAKDGISFDKASGHYRISDGVATTVEPLEVTGPSFDLAFEGALDLYQQTLNQRMLVTLPITENFALAAVFLATPQIAGAVFLVDKLIGKQLSKFTSVRYSIEGSWDDPQMTLLQSPKQQPQSLEIDH
ncbi:MAG: YhdP family protein [Motiliproteus sp.]